MTESECSVSVDMHVLFRINAGPLEATILGKGLRQLLAGQARVLQTHLAIFGAGPTLLRQAVHGTSGWLVNSVFWSIVGAGLACVCSAVMQAAVAYMTVRLRMSQRMTQPSVV